MEYFCCDDWTGFRAGGIFTCRANQCCVLFNRSAACEACSRLSLLYAGARRGACHRTRISRDPLLLRPTGQRRLVSRHLGNCEMTHRQEPLSVPMSIRRWSMRKHPAFQEARHARFQSQSHGLRLAYLGVHLERVNQRGFACAEYRVHGFSGPRRRRTGLFYFSFCPLLPAVPLSRRTQGSCGNISGPIWHLMSSRD